MKLPFLAACVAGARAFPAISRRDVIAIGTAFTAVPDAAFADVYSVDRWPGVEYLEPIFELKWAVDSLQRSPGEAPELVERFFGGRLDREYYESLNAKYQSKIVYRKSESEASMRLDESDRYQAMQETLDYLKVLSDQVKADRTGMEKFKSSADAAKVAMDRWFSFVPPQDAQRCLKMFIATKKADANRNGKLENEELASMSRDDRELWMKRVELFGE